MWTAHALRVSNGGTIADGTWQQFLHTDQRSPDLPKVLIGTPADMRKVALAAGITARCATILWADTQKAFSH